MSDIYDWNQPFGPAVILQLGTTSKVWVAVHTTREAAMFLLDKWPCKKTEKHTAACRACRDAIEGRAPAETARAALIEAARDAGFTVLDGSPPSGRSIRAAA